MEYVRCVLKKLNPNLLCDIDTEKLTGKRPCHIVLHIHYWSGHLTERCHKMDVKIVIVKLFFEHQMYMNWSRSNQFAKTQRNYDRFVSVFKSPL